MSIFKSKGIVLKKISVGEKDILYDIFTYDFWRIKAKKKPKTREKNLDIWYIINFEIETKEGKDIHRIRNIKIKSEFPYEWKSFLDIHEYLKFLHTIILYIPQGIGVKEVFDIVEKVNDKKTINAFKVHLARLKILDIVGVLGTQHSNDEVRKIVEYVRKNKIDDILKLKCENEEILTIIAQIL